MSLYNNYIIRIENLLLFILGIILYYHFNLNWVLFCIAFFIPDLSMIGYLLSKKMGAFTYNILHSFILPILLGIFFYKNETLLSLSLIWISHIAFDRTLGFGLKTTQGFFITHLNVPSKTDG